MTEGEKIIWGAIGALAVTVLGAVILGIHRLLAKRRNDRVSLRAGLTIAGDAEVVAAVATVKDPELKGVAFRKVLDHALRFER